ncbi:MAG: cadherin-like domain-containing protein [Deltaproteobacteria bacterium]|nr:cadherin-like domain-containing protein [Nannocystaceae bacterium]
MKRAKNLSQICLQLGVGIVGVGLYATPVHASTSGLVISEYRVRGPNGANDEFIEIANTGPAHTVESSSGTGYGIAASDAVVRCSIPDGTVIPQFGHYLCVNSVGYSWGSYPAGVGLLASGDATFATDIPDNSGIALFSTDVPLDFSLVTRMDAVGATTTDALYREGLGHPSIVPFSIDSSFYRNLSTPSISVPGFATLTPGLAEDTDDNATDFVWVDTNGTSAGAGQRLGSPGPENLSSPVTGGGLVVSLLDACVDASTAPNFVRDLTSDPAHNATFGTVEYRRTITNNTDQPLTRLRLRVADQRTFPAPSGVSDMRSTSSVDTVVTVDRSPCDGTTSDVPVVGTTLEREVSQPNGGGFNGSLSVTLAVPLAVGASIDVRVHMGLQQIGLDSFTFVAEALPGGGDASPVLFCMGATVVDDIATFCITPTATNDDYIVTADSLLTVLASEGVLANDLDLDSIVTDVVVESSTSDGTLTLAADGSFTYLPDPGFVGVDTFSYFISDGNSSSPPAVATITVEEALGGTSESGGGSSSDDAGSESEGSTTDVGSTEGSSTTDVGTTEGGTTDVGTTEGGSTEGGSTEGGTTDIGDDSTGGGDSSTIGGTTVSPTDTGAGSSDSEGSSEDTADGEALGDNGGCSCSTDGDGGLAPLGMLALGFVGITRRRRR